MEMEAPFDGLLKGVNTWFWSKKGHFSNFFVLGNLGRENVFYDILEQKKRPSRL